MDEFVAEPPKGIPKPLQRRVMIEGAYTEELANDTKKMAEHLRLPVKLLRRWRRREDFGGVTGWLSHPITREEYLTLLIIVNFVWELDETLRMQLSRKTSAARERLVNECDMTWIERTVYHDVLRHKLLGGRRHMKFSIYRKELEARYKNGYQQLNSKILIAMKKKAGNQIQKAREDGALELLAKSVDLEMRDGQFVRPRPATPVQPPIVRGDHNVPEEVLLRAEIDTAVKEEAASTCTAPPEESEPDDDLAEQIREWEFLAFYSDLMQVKREREKKKKKKKEKEKEKEKDDPPPAT
ncbi:MAG: hypothetical protein CXR31_00335 [Geobacter sp.]|nr:MAG: hypothetical protein CXR31_00335 [Geobacter sp.]